MHENRYEDVLSSMITYLVTRRHSYTMGTFVSLWGKKFGPQIRVMSYEYLLKSRNLGGGSYIFSDIERLSHGQTKRLADVWKLLSEESHSCLLNHPLRTMRRFQLVRALYERGLNNYNIYRLNEGQMPERYPVFLRDENDHSGNLTPLLYTYESLLAALKKNARRRPGDTKTVIVEFCNTSDPEGIFRKYSAFIIGERIIPVHVMFGRHWMLKSVEDLPGKESEIREEQDYVLNNPHEKHLREIFSLAGVRYGRIDYGMLGEKIQVWEINTNPIVIGIYAVSPARKDLRIHSLKQMTSAFEAIDRNAEQGLQQRSLEAGRAVLGDNIGLKHAVSRNSALMADNYYAFLFGVYRTIKPYYAKWRFW